MKEKIEVTESEYVPKYATITLSEYQWAIIKSSLGMQLFSTAKDEPKNEYEQKELNFYREAHKELIRIIENADYTERDK